MPRETLAVLERDLKHAALTQGLVCYEPGDAIEQIYFPTSGMLSFLVVTGDGETIETNAVGREGAAGLQRGLGRRRSFTRAVVQIPGRFSTIVADRFEQAVGRDTALRELVMRYIETQWAEAEQIAACNALHDGSARLCRWLLQSADRTGSEQLPLTQEFLADMLGVRRTTVTLLAQDLQKQGIVRYSRGRITIIDRAALETMACECYGVIKEASRSLATDAGS